MAPVLRDTDLVNLISIYMDCIYVKTNLIKFHIFTELDKIGFDQHRVNVGRSIKINIIKTEKSTFPCASDTIFQFFTSDHQTRK